MIHIVEESFRIEAIVENRCLHRKVSHACDTLSLPEGGNLPTFLALNFLPRRPSTIMSSVYITHPITPSIEISPHLHATCLNPKTARAAEINRCQFPLLRPHPRHVAPYFLLFPRRVRNPKELTSSLGAVWLVIWVVWYDAVDICVMPENLENRLAKIIVGEVEKWVDWSVREGGLRMVFG